MTHVVGRDGTELLAVDRDPATAGRDRQQLTYGVADDCDALRARARRVGVREVSRRTGLVYETVRKWANGGATSPTVLVSITDALEDPRTPDVPPGSSCALPECPEPARPRSRWCSERHKKTGARRTTRATPGDPLGALPACATCGARFINPAASELHHCEGPRP